MQKEESLPQPSPCGEAGAPHAAPLLPRDGHGQDRRAPGRDGEGGTGRGTWVSRA